MTCSPPTGRQPFPICLAVLLCVGLLAPGAGPAGAAIKTGVGVHDAPDAAAAHRGLRHLDNLRGDLAHLERLEVDLDSYAFMARRLRFVEGLLAESRDLTERRDRAQRLAAAREAIEEAAIWGEEGSKAPNYLRAELARLHRMVLDLESDPTPALLKLAIPRVTQAREAAAAESDRVQNEFDSLNDRALQMFESVFENFGPHQQDFKLFREPADRP